MMTAYTHTMTMDATRKGPILSFVIISTLCKVLDIISIVFISNFVLRLMSEYPDKGNNISGIDLSIAIIAAIIFVLFLREMGGYDPKNLLSVRFQILKVAPIWIANACLILTILSFFESNRMDLALFLFFWSGASLASLLTVRTAYLLLLRYWRYRGILQRKVVVIGAGETGIRVVNHLMDLPESYLVLGIFDDRQSRVPREVRGVPVLGSVHDLLVFARQQLPDEIIVTLPLNNSERLRTGLKALTVLPVDLRLTCETVAPGFKLRNISYIGNIPVIDIFQRPLRDWNFVYKWLEDKIVALFALILLAPVLILCAILIKIDSPGPVLFKQDRFGYNNKIITVLKFRTMYIDRGDESGAERTVRGDRRVTPLGKILRAFSLDELPQLFNVLRGDMSLVGPRAHAVAMRVAGKLYGDTVEEYFARHRVPPGLTGLAQVNGLRGEISDVDMARKRLQFDLDYIDRWSIGLDLKIMVKSIWVVLFERDNAY
jgi:Undecaprenyl-phosphate glucose phosphotransferase